MVRQTSTGTRTHTHTLSRSKSTTSMRNTCSGVVRVCCASQLKTRLFGTQSNGKSACGRARPTDVTNFVSATVFGLNEFHTSQPLLTQFLFYQNIYFSYFFKKLLFMFQELLDCIANSHSPLFIHNLHILQKQMIRKFKKSGRCQTTNSSVADSANALHAYTLMRRSTVTGKAKLFRNPNCHVHSLVWNQSYSIVD